MKDRALLVGINEYPGSPLHGCVNDVTDMAEHLVSRCGFAADSVRLLTDARATTAEIVARLHWLMDVEPNGRVFFHFSGHGTQIANRNNQAEVDGLDEAICPVDFDWSPERMLTDDRLLGIFKRLPGGTLFNWVSDSCHSGDLSRGLPGGPKNAARRMLPPADMAWRIRTAKAKQIALHGHREALAANGVSIGFVSACRSDQTASDTAMNNRPCGALTHFLLEAFNQLPAGTALNDVVAHAARALSSAGFSQQPQVEGSRAAVPFLS
jgi:hypothetical protein